MSGAAERLVHKDTEVLINEANRVVSECTGTGCNVSETTRTEIRKRVSTASQEISVITLEFLRISPGSAVSKEINRAYLELGEAVSATYNFQCGATTSSAACVNASSSVTSSQNKLISLLDQPLKGEVRFFGVFSLLFLFSGILALVGIVLLIVGVSAR